MKRTKLPTSKETLSLNVSEVLSPISSKKPLYNNFPEPIPGPSGYQTRKIVNSTSLFSDDVPGSSHTPITSSGKQSKVTHKESRGSDSEESTSGYSSGRVGSKEIVSQESSKQTSPSEVSPRKNRSLFQNSNLSQLLSTDSPNKSNSRNSSLSSRAPSFNPSVFGSGSFVDRTLSSKRILSSPFYQGTTIYGGASAYCRNSQTAPQNVQRVLRSNVSIKPTNRTVDKGNLQLGKTARRILDTLEQYSSPVSDAKKIPVASKRGILTKYTGANPYTVRESRTCSNKELQVPSVSELLKMKMDHQKTKLQESTESVRQIAAANSSETYQIPVQRDNDRHVTKIRNKVSSVRQKTMYEEVVPEVQLTPISLPIKELPKFDLPLPSRKVQMSDTPSAQIRENKEESDSFKKQETSIKQQNNQNAPKNDGDFEFKFSDPLVLAECLKPLKALNNFKFSEPLIKKRKSIHPELDDQDNKASAEVVKTKRNNGESVKESKDEVKSNVTMVKSTNQNSTGTSPTIITFKAPEGTWECPTCMIRNKNDLPRCAACDEKKPDGNSTMGCTNNQQEPKTAALPKPVVPIKTSFTWDSKSIASFGSSSTTWECPTCMIRNKEEVTKCAACETTKPGSSGDGNLFGSNFKKSDDEWECPVCMVRNKENAEKCQCCETSNPSVKGGNVTKNSDPLKVSQFNFGIDKATVSSFMFGIPPEANKVGATTTTTTTTKASLIFADNRQQQSASQDNPPSFTFGIPAKKDDATKEPNKEKIESSSLVSNAVKMSEATNAVTFSFGTNPTATSTLASTSTVVPTFSFGKNSTVSNSSTSAATAPTFSFGKNSTTASSTAATVPMFSFGTAKQTTETNKSLEQPTTTTTASPIFSFGVKTNESSCTAEVGATSTAKTFTFGSLSKTESGKTTATVPIVNETVDKVEKTNDKPEFSFGLTKVSSSTPEATNNLFAPVKSSKRSHPDDSDQPPPLAKMPTFSFKPPTTNGDLDKQSLSKPVEETKVPIKGFSFNFSTAKTDTNSGTTAMNNNAPLAPTFGTSSTVTQADSTKPTMPTFKFGASSETAKQTNGFSFGSSLPAFASKIIAEPPSYPAQTTAPSTSSAFGVNAKVSATGGVFGSSTAKSAFSSNPFSTTAVNANNANQPFSFNSASSPATFNLQGGDQKKDATGFGALGTSQSGNPFGNASSSSNNSLFGTTPAQNSSQNGTFNFGGSSNNNNKAATGFSFGVSSTSSSGTNDSGTKSSGFNFGSSAMNSGTTSSTVGFNFSSSAPPPAFNANAKPNFNFTGGAELTTFSAPPAQDGAPQRKIKKAIRRTIR
ncbi:hypothetical protein ABEB36_001049 [Hypothenemus hampei]